jgi:hypothetical protein
MTEKQVKAYIAGMKKFTKKVASSSADSRNLLIKAGIITDKGNLKKPYK